MKKLFTLIAVLIGLHAVAQNIPPQAINFQGVAIDKNGIPVPGMDELGNPIQNSAIRVRFSILTGTATGTISYQEEHLTTTDEFGRFNLEIGRGTATNGVFSAINWGGDKHFLQVEVDLSALGTNYTLASVQEFLSVPYALYAKTAGSTGDGDTDPTNEIQTLTLTGNLLEISMGNSVTLPPNTDSQTLSIVGDTLTISGGNSVTIPDAQTLSLNGTALSISNGNSVNLLANTDNQTLSLTGNNLSILNGNSVTLPTSLDNDSTNELQTLSLSNGILSISNGNSISLPSSGNSSTNNSQNCLTSPKVFQLPVIVNQGINTVIAFHDSLVLIQTYIYFPTDTIYYLHSFKNSTTTVVPIVGQILHFATSDSLVFLQSKSNIFTLNLETGSLLTRSLATPFVDVIKVDHKTKHLYSSCGVQNQSTWRIYKYVPTTNSLTFITLSPLNNRTFEVVNTDTLNVWPTNSYIKFSTNTTITSLTPAPLFISSYHDYCKCYISDYHLGRNNLQKQGLNYQSNGGLSLGYSSEVMALRFQSTNSKTYAASVNFTGTNQLNYLNNLSSFSDHYIIEFDINTGLSTMKYSSLTAYDYVRVTDGNLLTTLNRPACVNGVFYSNFVLLVD